MFDVVCGGGLFYVGILSMGERSRLGEQERLLHRPDFVASTQMCVLGARRLDRLRWSAVAIVGFHTIVISMVAMARSDFVLVISNQCGFSCRDSRVQVVET